jgi:hypothetical protein
MPARLSIVALLLVCLLFRGQVAPAPAPLAAVEHGCAMMNCGGACCESTSCCDAMAQQQAPTEKASTSAASAGLDAAVFRLCATTVLPWSSLTETKRPTAEHAIGAPARPRLAVSCIHLI